jgi:lipopolysaccharide/colanic/teichoic acid biosynthesis glycosyltransferase
MSERSVLNREHRNARPPILLVDDAGEPHFAYSFAKRTIDLVGALTLLVVLSPILLLAAALVLSTSGRPLLFGQERIGYRGRPFTFWKLRTMVPDAESRRDEVLALNTTNGPTFKAHKDPRVTRVGRWLRTFSIDEIPQLWNVLLGDMSLVGPRPLPTIENVYTGRQSERLSVKPGVTCIWQVSGRSAIGFDRWMQMDLEYVDHRSTWRDILLLLRTPIAVITRRGAS